MKEEARALQTSKLQRPLWCGCVAYQQVACTRALPASGTVPALLVCLDTVFKQACCKFFDYASVDDFMHEGRLDFITSRVPIWRLASGEGLDMIA